MADRNMLLNEIWFSTPAKGSNAAAEARAEETRKRLESGDLVPTGNCRNVDRDSYWTRDEEGENE